MGAASSGPSSSASYCARPGWQSPNRSAADSSGAHNARGKFQTTARTNEVLGKFLESIVHAPLGKHETRHTTYYPQPFSSGGCGHSFRCLTQARRGHVRLHSFADKAVKRRRDALKLSARREAISKT